MHTKSLTASLEFLQVKPFILPVSPPTFGRRSILMFRV